MTPKQFKFLQSAVAQQTLASITVNVEPANRIKLVTQLRQNYSPDEVHALVETALLRQKGGQKFSRAANMYFTADGLEQASGELIGAYRATQFKAIGAATIFDLGCGIGGDALSLSQVGTVFGVDREEVRLRMARANVAAYGHVDRFCGILADLTRFAAARADALFFDPARRDARGKRIYSLKAYRPPLTILDLWRPLVRGMAVKIGPGIDYRELPPRDEAGIEFISVNGGVKEGLLWFGAFRDRMPSGRRATLLPAGVTLDQDQTDEAIVLPEGEPMGYLYEPDGAVIRARLVGELGARHGMAQIDRSIAYLTADREVKTPFATGYRVIDHFPFNLKKLRRYVAENRFGELTIKKRGSPIDPDWLRQRLKKYKGGRSAILFMTKKGGAPWVIVSDGRLE